MNIKNTKKRSRKPALVVTVVLAVLLAGYVAVAALLHLPPFQVDKKSTDTDTVSGQYVNMDRTDTEKQATKVLEENPEQKTQNNQNDTPSDPDTTANGKQAASVLLTNAGIFNGTVSASGMVTNIAEQGGSCIYTFTNGSSTITKVSTTLINPTSTTCETVSFPSNELPKAGMWTIKLKYTSSTSEGTSVNTKEFTK